MGTDSRTSPLSPEFITRNGDLFTKHFPADLDEQSMILKAHMLLEATLRDFCASCVTHPEHLRGRGFQFAHVLSLAQALCPVTELNPYAEMLWALAKNLQRLRNAMAHELEPDPNKIEKCKNAIVSLVNQQERGRVYDLRGSLEFMLGSFNAFLHFALFVAEHQHKQTNE
ncbi:hypothetical protein [Pseudomonas sp. Teo4]|uniref:hypothetical protein n=1 Tax=Pseudomonas sp. Teo4 TaxID=3064528 RepID=UPI002AB9AB02|nr:hypothetical protein [Pseudomonas sp. Teo4]MDZ3994872.1 hypothetical protein [Pseudomonas sp. Teo4]